MVIERDSPEPEARDVEPRPRRRRWLRVPSFRTAWLLSFGVLFVLVAWIFVDASFRATYVVGLSVIGIKQTVFPMPFTERAGLGWQLLGERLAILVVLAIVGLAANVVVLSRLSGGQAGGRTLKAYATATALVGLWLSFFLYLDDLQWAAFRFRLQWRLAEYKSLLQELADDWPKEAGTLPALGRYTTHGIGDVSNLELTDRGAGFPMWDEPGRIRRWANGTVQLDGFSTCRGGFSLELVPPSGTPTDMEERPGGPSYWPWKLQESIQLGESLYLTRYDVRVYRD